jgi:hypothetical protein
LACTIATGSSTNAASSSGSSSTRGSNTASSSTAAAAAACLDQLLEVLGDMQQLQLLRQVRHVFSLQAAKERRKAKQ